MYRVTPHYASWNTTNATEDSTITAKALPNLVQSTRHNVGINMSRATERTCSLPQARRPHHSKVVLGAAGVGSDTVGAAGRLGIKPRVKLT